MTRVTTYLSLLAAATVLAGALAGRAEASQLIDRNPSAISLAVNTNGQALVTYRARGRVWHVLAWGAINARPPTRNVRQVKFRLDYSGGWRTFRKQVWRNFPNRCLAYDGPALKWMVKACKATDGSYWALQAWQRALPNYGLRPNARQSVWELRLSHWVGELPVLDIRLNWAYRRYHHLYGRYTYGGVPVYGFRSKPNGEPLDTYGRNIYVDTLSSRYGTGWKRENSFLAHTRTGAFCYGFFPHGSRPTGMGVKYRATVIGPGVAPDVYWEGVAPGPYDRNLDTAANNEIRGLNDKACKPN